MKLKELLHTLHTQITAHNGVAYSGTLETLISYSVYEKPFIAIKYFNNSLYFHFVCDEKHFIDPAEITRQSQYPDYHKKLNITAKTSLKLIIFFIEHSYNFILKNTKVPETFTFEPIQEYIRILEEILEDNIIEKSEQEYVNNYLKAVNIPEKKAKSIFLRTLAEKTVQLLKEKLNFLAVQRIAKGRSVTFSAENTKKEFFKMNITDTQIIFSVYLHEKDKVRLSRFIDIFKPDEKKGWYLFSSQKIEDLTVIVSIVHIALNRAVHGDFCSYYTY